MLVAWIEKKPTYWLCSYYISSLDESATKIPSIYSVLLVGAYYGPTSIVEAGDRCGS